MNVFMPRNPCGEHQGAAAKLFGAFEKEIYGGFEGKGKKKKAICH